MQCWCYWTNYKERYNIKMSHLKANHNITLSDMTIVEANPLLRPFIAFHYPVYALSEAFDSLPGYGHALLPLSCLLSSIAGSLIVSFKFYPLLNPRLRFITPTLFVNLLLTYCLVHESHKRPMYTKPILLSYLLESWADLGLSLIWDFCLVVAIVASFYVLKWKGRFITLVVTLIVLGFGQSCFHPFGYSYSTFAFYLAAIVGSLSGIGAVWSKRYWILMSCLLCREFSFFSLLLYSVFTIDFNWLAVHDIAKILLMFWFPVCAAFLHHQSSNEVPEQKEEEHALLI